MKEKIQQSIPVAVASAVLIILVFTGIYRCPLDSFLGIPCPLCGITRALKSIMRGDFIAAFYYHPLWPVLMIYAALYILSSLKMITLSKKTTDVFGYLLCSLLIICFILRHIWGSPVVRLHYETSFINRVFNWLTSMGGEGMNAG